MTTAPRPQFCPHCGAARAGDWAFCQLCGKPLPASGSPDKAPLSIQDELEAALWREANRLLEDGAYQLAENCLHLLREKTGESPEVLALLGMVCLRRYRPAAARELLDRASTLAPSSAFVRLKRAEYWLALGVVPKARDELNLALTAAAGKPGLRDQIRSLIRKLEGDAKWSFSRATPMPNFDRIRRALRIALFAHGRDGKAAPSVGERVEKVEKGEVAWLQ